MAFLDSQRAATSARLTQGELVEGAFVFDYQAVGSFFPYETPANVQYIVSEVEDGIAIEGTIETPSICCDVPYHFEHRNVLAVYQPALRVEPRETGVSLLWETTAGQVYRLQYRPVPDPEAPWTGLGEEIIGDGSPAMVDDDDDVTDSARIYRLAIVP